MEEEERIKGPDEPAGFLDAFMNERPRMQASTSSSMIGTHQTDPAHKEPQGTRPSKREPPPLEDDACSGKAVVIPGYQATLHCLARGQSFYGALDEPTLNLLDTCTATLCSLVFRSAGKQCAAINW